MVSDEEKNTADDSRFRELSPGKLLVWGRERAGLTQEQIAKELYMTLTKVRAMESDDYRHMGTDTFTRGYLRSYANLVKLDVVQVLAAYDRYAQKHGLIEQVLPRKIESTAKPLWQFVLLIAAALLILWLISVWFFDNRKEPEYDMPTAVISPVETLIRSNAASSSSINEGSFSSSHGEGVITQAFDLNTSSSSSSFISVASSSVVSSFESAVLNIGSDEIVFIFTEECWLEVSDSRGDVLMADLQGAGTRLVLKGKAPFDVKLGNAPATQIELNKEKIAVVPALGTNVLSMKVGKIN